MDPGLDWVEPFMELSWDRETTAMSTLQDRSCEENPGKV